MSETSDGPIVSVIIPARNEHRLIVPTVASVVASCLALDHCSTRGAAPTWELIVVDNASEDATMRQLYDYLEHQPPSVAERVHIVELEQLGAARARNAGRKKAAGRVLVFVDADTSICRGTISQIVAHCQGRRWVAGITALGARDGDWRAALWWAFWNQVRRLPIARAKAMPALMFCTDQAFDHFGPFDERVAIGEEWPILAGLYRHRRADVIYDRALVARSSCRRMQQIRCGYFRTLCKYAWAIVSFRGRIHYTDRIR